MFCFQTPCLLQIAIDDFIIFIDLLKEQNIIQPLIPIFEDPSIDKIFFDAPWDQYSFQKYLHLTVKGIKDIQICSSLLYPTIGTVSLIKLVKDEFNINIKKPKKQQKSDWTRRPLNRNQIQYASHEITWFLPVYDALIQKIQKQGLSPFFQYGNSRLEIEKQNLDYSPLQVRKIKGFNTLSNKESQRLVQLGLLRDKIARKRNRPSFFILTNQQLLELAKDGQTLDSVLSHNQKLGKNVNKQVNQILNQSYPDSSIMKNIDNFSDHAILKQKLLTWRFGASKKFKLPKRLIISKSEMDSFDDSCFENQTSLLRSLWFTKRKDPLCQELTNDVTMFLQSASND